MGENRLHRENLFFYALWRPANPLLFPANHEFGHQSEFFMQIPGVGT